MLYLLVLVGSLFGICVLFGARMLLRTRAVRRFVRGVKQRFDDVEGRGVVLVEETVLEKPRKSPRASAIELQQVRSLARMAEKALLQEKYEEAERLFIQALTIQPNALDIQAQLAKLYLTTDRETKAEALYRELIGKRDDVTFHSNLGLAYYRHGKFVEACQAYQEALNRDPQTPERSQPSVAPASPHSDSRRPLRSSKRPRPASRAISNCSTSSPSVTCSLA